MSKKLLSFVCFLTLALNASAQGWPENYGGVMLQGFWWDSYDDTKWTNLTEQADELSKYFDLIWVPNSGYCRQEKSMGYNPVYWYNHNSAFGKPKELLTMINTFKEKGTGIIMDVVINHRNGVNDWADFPSEKNSLDGNTYQLTSLDVTKNDDGGYTASKGIEVGPNNDTGDDFSGGRDLDHMSQNVQENCKAYCKFLLEKIGYVGFRLDMVKGYAPEYTKMYNEYSKPQFCVGEFWDGKEAITWWINGTGKTSAAFDFPLKYQLNKAFGSGDFGALADKGLAGDPSINRYAVTFVDNHDSDRESYNRCVSNQLGATAFILGLPGTPCVFLKHWKKWGRDIGNMILARKAAGLTNQSSIVWQGTVGSGYVVKTQGTNGTVMVTAGNVGNYDTSGFTLITKGSSFAYYVSNNVTVEGLNYDELPKKDYDLYICAYGEPNVYAWDNEGNIISDEWPGTKLTEVVRTPNETEWYHIQFNATALNLIINNGSKQTANIEDIDEGTTYIYYNGKTGYEFVDDGFFKPVPPQGITVHVNAPTAPFLYAWDDSGSLNGEWPGTKMTQTETGSNGTVWYVETIDADQMNIIFNNGKTGDDERKTADILGLAEGDYYFAYNGYTGCEVVDKDYAPSAEKLIVHVCADQAPYLYAWDAEGTPINGTWPGTLMTEVTTTANGTEWFTTTLTGVATASIIFNNGNGGQTADIKDVTGEVYYYYNGASGFQKVDANYQKGDIEDNTISIYVKMVPSTHAGTSAPCLYAWDDFGTPINGTWPGTVMTETETVSGETFFVKTFVADGVNIILNNGQEDDELMKTEDITGLTADSYFEYDGGTQYTDITGDFGEFRLPDCAVYQDGKLFIYFEANADYPTPFVWAWTASGNLTGSEWPGSGRMEKVGENKGNGVYTYVFNEEPTGLLFANVENNTATTQTADFQFVNAGYYSVKGLRAVVPEVATGIESSLTSHPSPLTPVYDLQGRRLNGQPQRGLYIQNGRKVVVK